MRLVAFASLICVVGIASAEARPDGADWTVAGAPGQFDCSACHFDSAPKRDDAALAVSGLPSRIAPDGVYELDLRLRSDGAANAGFLIRAEINGKEAGGFETLDGRTEARGGSLRSTLLGARLTAPGDARWRFKWRAPERLEGDVVFYVAANAGNDDRSPFGDQVYLSSFRVRR